VFRGIPLIWGKLIGFFFGYIIFGPLGAAIGTIAGHTFDHGLRKSFIPEEQASRIQALFFQATFLIMGKLAKSDGLVSRNEIAHAERVMDDFGLSPTEKREAIELFTQGKNSMFAMHSILASLYQVCNGRKDILYLFLEIQLTAALSDGPLSRNEQIILRQICQLLQFDLSILTLLEARIIAQKEFSSFKSRSYRAQTGSEYRSSYTQDTNKIDGAYKILGVANSASQSEIKKAYRKLMSQHHPDKMVAKGLPQGMIALAKEKTQQITAAYDLICKTRSFR